MDVSHRALFANKSARAATIYDDIAWSVRRGRGLTCSELLPSVTCSQVRWNLIQVRQQHVSLSPDKDDAMTTSLFLACRWSGLAGWLGASFVVLSAEWLPDVLRTRITTVPVWESTCFRQFSSVSGRAVSLSRCSVMFPVRTTGLNSAVVNWWDIGYIRFVGVAGWGNGSYWFAWVGAPITYRRVHNGITVTPHHSKPLPIL